MWPPLLATLFCGKQGLRALWPENTALFLNHLGVLSTQTEGWSDEKWAKHASLLEIPVEDAVPFLRGGRTGFSNYHIFLGHIVRSQ